ncbi:MAG TPA: hemerythrin domain-containing protein [Jatrophihabitans sp.]
MILDEHAWFRKQFARLDDLQARTPLPVEAVEKLWTALAARLDVHAIAEEEIFYPQLLKKGADPEAETLDAIGDHNDIRDGIHDAARHALASAAWWQAVGQARQANDEHMAEEEREGLADFRLHAPAGLREALGRRFAEFIDAHPGTAGLDTSDKDPETYVRTIETELSTHRPSGGDGSLGIGSLKGE